MLYGTNAHKSLFGEDGDISNFSNEKGMIGATLVSKSNI